MPVWPRLATVIAACAMVTAGLLATAVPATADTTIFTQGCSVQTIPAGDNTVAITAFGASGSTGYNQPHSSESGAPGGSGAGVSSTVTYVSGQLYVCVNVGGGTGTSVFPGAGYGNGGGASGVSLGSDFSHPVVVAGGGGGGAGLPDGAGCAPCGSGAGGNAGHPNGGGGAQGEESGGGGTGGGGGTQTGGGGGGLDNFAGANAPGGGCSNSSGPGSGGSDNGEGGYGGAGGAGYCGGGAGAGESQDSGGGGGGSDFCNNSAVPRPPIVWQCSEGPAGFWPPEVQLAYSYTPPTTAVYVNDGGSGQVDEVPLWGGSQTDIGAGSPTASYGNFEYNNAAGLAVDPAGDVFAPNGSAGTLNEIPAGGTETTIASDISTPNGVARDNSGNLFVPTAYGVERFVGGIPDYQFVGNTAPGTEGAAVDALGNVFIADSGFDPNRVVEVPADGSPQRTIYGESGTSSLGGLDVPSAVAVDTAGDVFIADTYNNRVLKVTPSGTASVVANNLTEPEALALDAYGDLFIANAGANNVVEVPVGGGAQTTIGSGFTDPSGLAVYAPPPTFTADTPAGYAPEGSSYSYTFAAQSLANEPAATFVVASGSLPPGLSLNTTTGVLSGTPTASGAYTFVVEAENVANGTATSPITIVTAPPTVTGVDPTAGPTSGGNTVTITGTNFASGATTVKFGSTAATAIQVQSPSTLTAAAPSGTGTVDVTVGTAGGTSPTSSADQYTYDAAPTVTGVSPNFGPRAGGNTVTITGSNFLSGATVDFGPNAATSVDVESASQLTAVVPVHKYGTVDVTITTPGGTSPNSAADQYAYGLPSVRTVSPTAGPSGGGNTVTITGTNFAAGATVDFGANAATSVDVQSPHTLTAVAPSGSGTVDVTVTTPGGTSTTSKADHYSYGPPSVSAVTPAVGPTGGGNTVTITGANFAAGATVDFGANAATSVNVQSSTKVTAVAPAGSYGTVDVTVSTPGGTSATSSADQYGYGRPSVSAVSPRTGPAGGGQAVTITGANFDSGATVQFGSAAATSVQESSSTQLTATTPPGSGTVDVTVTTSQGGTSALSSADHYNYSPTPTITHVSPSSGSVVGGNTVTIIGAHFAAGATVNVGSRGAASVNVVSASKLTATVPPAPAGRVDVTVTTPLGGTSAASSTDAYTYLPQVGEVYAVLEGNTLQSGQLVQLLPGGPQTTVASGLDEPSGVAVDGAGDVFMVQQYPDSDVVEYYARGGQRTLAGGTYPVSVAVDAEGDAFVGNQLGVQKFPAAGGQTTVYSSPAYPPGVAVDDHGDVFFSGNSGEVIEVHPDGTQSTVASGLSNPQGLAVDTQGDVFIADEGSNQVLEVPAGGGPTRVVSGVGRPDGVALDAAGNVFISADGAGGPVVEVPADGGPQTTVAGLPYPQGIAVYAPPPTFTADAPPASAPKGQAYSYTYTARPPSSEPPATFALASGQLPPGLSLNGSTGVLSGTPTASGVYTFAVQTQNAVQATLGRTTTIATAPPTVTAASPHSGPIAGGTTVTILGTGFTPGTAVWFGSTRATSVTVASTTKIVATAPAHAAGIVNVHVATAGGSSTQAEPYAFGPPTVTAVSPDGGPIAGGTTVTIRGTGFVPGATAWFSSTRATSVTVDSATKIVATAPAATTAGIVNVHVITGGGSSTQAEPFAYGPPTVTSISPHGGPTAGGTTVTMVGTGFVPGATVWFGSTRASSVTGDSATKIVAIAPAATNPGVVHVRVATPGGSSISGAATAYTYGAS
jgi:sugar lactone lactonase YvrE